MYQKLLDHPKQSATKPGCLKKAEASGNLIGDKI